MLYTDEERLLMASAVQESMRSKNIPQRPFAKIIADELDLRQLRNRHVLDIGPGQCDFLDLAKQYGACTYGVDFDPAVVSLGKLRGHEMQLADLMKAWPYEAAKFDGIFCRGSLNCYWFASNIVALEQFLDGLHEALKPDGWIWIAPWNRPPEGGTDIPDEVKACIERWAVKNGIEIWLPNRKYRKKYGIGYEIPMIHVWRKNTRKASGNLFNKLFSSGAAINTDMFRNIWIGKRLGQAWQWLAKLFHLSGKNRKVDTEKQLKAEVVALRTWIEFLRRRAEEQEKLTASSLQPLDQPRTGPVATASEDVPLPPAPLPLAYYEEGLRLLIDRGDVEFITYDDLAWSDDWNYHERYPAEWAAWRNSLTDKTRDPAKCYVLIQHDCDSGPVATVKMARLEKKLGIRSSIMVFERWQRGSEVVPYPIDWDALQVLREQGFVFGYHCNAYHNSDFDEGGAYEEFSRDYDKILGRNLDVRYFSAHGGKASADGRVNSSFDYPLVCGRRQLRWVHNGHTPRFANTFSDGALTRRLKENDPNLDFHAWAKSLRPGYRYRALLHPQYFTDGEVAPVPDVTLPWYLNAVESYSALKLTNKQHDKSSNFHDQ